MLNKSYEMIMEAAAEEFCYSCNRASGDEKMAVIAFMCKKLANNMGY
jgi:hypothetical protein